MADDNAIRLLEEALCLRMNGERAPGAGPWPAETWREWEGRVETYLRETAPDGKMEP